MDAIASVSAAQQGALQSQISAAVAKKQLNAIELQGQAAVELLQSAAQLSKAAGRGGSFDGVA